MSERYVIPSEEAKCSWAEGGAAYPSTDPGAGKRDVGWQPKDDPVPGPGEVIPATGHNFLWRLGMQMITWLRNLAARQWSDVSLGIAAAANLDIFRVMPSATIQPRGTEVFSVTGTATGNTTVFQPCTDGEQTYYAGGAANQYIVGASPIDGAEIFEANDLGAVAISAVCCDGLRIYVQTTNVGTPGLYSLIRTSGLEEEHGGTEYGCDALAANGYHCVGIDPTTKTGYLVIYSSIQSGIVEDGTHDTGSANLRAVAIDATQCYVGGTRNTDDVWCLALSDHTTAIWTTTLATSSAPEVYGIAADGDRVYVATDRQALTAGGYANLYCLDRFTGAVLWSMDVTTQAAAALDLIGVAVDQRYVYAVDAYDDLHVISKLGVPGQLLTVADFGRPVCDGVSVIGNSELTTELRRLWMADGCTTMQRVPYTDVARRPFHTLAVPIDR